MYKVGLELELKPVSGATREQILNSIRAKGINIRDEHYTHEVMSSWKAVNDSSVYGGFELVSPPLAGMPRIEREVSLICEAVKGLAKVDRQCGFHLHIDVLNKYWAKRRVNVNNRAGKLKAIDSKPVRLFCAKLLKNYAYFQPVIDAIVAPSRRVLDSHAYNNQIQDEWANITDEQLEIYSEDKSMISPPRGLNESQRYNVVNFVSLAKYGTVEFRQFQGTLNATKIVNWTKLMERFVARTADRKYKNQDCRNYPITVDGMCDFLGFGASERRVRGWVRDRVAQNGFSAIAAVVVRDPNMTESQRQNMTDEILMATANYYPLYRRMRTLYGRGQLTPENVQEAVRRELVAMDAPEEGPNHLSVFTIPLWDSMDWPMIRDCVRQSLNG